VVRERKGETVKHLCLRRHQANPALLPRSRRGRKRAKRATATDGSESQNESSDVDTHGNAEEGAEEDDMEA